MNQVDFTQFFILIGAFIVLMFVYRVADKKIKTLSPKTVKTVNWIGFGMALAGGILWYLFHTWVYMPVTVLGVIIYFLFYGYDKMEEEQK